MLTFTDETRAEYAEARSTSMASDEALLLPKVSRALASREFDDVIYFAVKVAMVEYQRHVAAIKADAGEPSWAGSFRRQLATMLNAAKKPELGQAALSAERLASSIVTSAYGLAVEQAAAAGWEKEWISEHDDKVRSTHADVDGQRIPLGEKFDVGGAKMSRPGDLSAPVEAWINCRCVLGIREPQASVTAAGTSKVSPGESVAVPGDSDEVAVPSQVGTEDRNTGIIIVGLPTPGDPVNALSAEVPPHVTLAYLGDSLEPSSDPELTQRHNIIDDVATDVLGYGTWHPIQLDVKNRGELGDEGADVLFLDGAPMAALREELLSIPSIKAMHDAVEQYPDWTAHLTLGYPDNPAPEGEPPATITIDRLALLWNNEATEFPLNQGAQDMPEEDMPAAEPDASPVEPAALEVMEIPWHSVATVEGVLTGDRRIFQRGSLDFRILPFSLLWQKVTAGGHDGSVVVGRVDNMWRDGELIKSDGVFALTAEADEFIQMVAGGFIRGVSVDVDDVVVEYINEDGSPLDLNSEVDLGAVIVESMVKGRVCGLTGCAIPAFQEAYIALGPWEDSADDHVAPPKEPESELEDVELEEPLVAAAFADVAPGVTEDGPGWLTNPVDTDRLRDYWVRGEGAAKIGWGIAGDFNRCRMNLAEYVKPQYLSGYCANRHKDALGVWPGQEHSAKTALGLERGAPMTIVAAAQSGDLPPADWFADPGLAGPSAVTISTEGRIFGHVATWGTCHVGFGEASCVTAPKSASSYAYFRTGSVLTDAGEVSVGQITMDTGHASMEASPQQTLAHYDNTGNAVADVAAGEDEFGIWIAGRVRPGVDQDQVSALRAGALSGDWRRIGGNLELVAALAVNVPGFPIPRASLAASAGHQDALVAASIVTQVIPQEPIDIETVVNMALDRRDARARRAKVTAALTRIKMDPAARLAAARERLGG